MKTNVEDINGQKLSCVHRQHSMRSEGVSFHRWKIIPRKEKTKENDPFLFDAIIIKRPRREIQNRKRLRGCKKRTRNYSSAFFPCLIFIHDIRCVRVSVCVCVFASNHDSVWQTEKLAEGDYLRVNIFTCTNTDFRMWWHLFVCCFCQAKMDRKRSFYVCHTHTPTHRRRHNSFGRKYTK